MVEDQVERVVCVLLLEGGAGVMAAEPVQVAVVGGEERGAALGVLGAVVEVAAAPGAVGRPGGDGGAAADGARSLGYRAGHGDGIEIEGEIDTGKRKPCQIMILMSKRLVKPSVPIVISITSNAFVTWSHRFITQLNLSGSSKSSIPFLSGFGSRK